MDLHSLKLKFAPECKNDRNFAPSLQLFKNAFSLIA